VTLTTDKPVKTVIRHLPGNSPAEDITVAFQEPGYDVISAKQMTAKRPAPEGGVTHFTRSLPNNTCEKYQISRNTQTHITL
jgi:hypothetical protein